jgi:predicted transcriptional regulator
MSETSAQPKPTSVRLDPDVQRKLDEFRMRERRSITSAVNYLLAKALEAEEPTR